jgi:hypothetical protein
MRHITKGEGPRNRTLPTARSTNDRRKNDSTGGGAAQREGNQWT